MYNIWFPPLPSTTNITSNYVSKQNFIFWCCCRPSRAAFNWATLALHTVRAYFINKFSTFQHIGTWNFHQSTVIAYTANKLIPSTFEINLILQSQGTNQWFCVSTRRASALHVHVLYVYLEWVNFPKLSEGPHRWIVIFTIFVWGPHLGQNRKIEFLECSEIKLWFQSDFFFAPYKLTHSNV